MFKLKTKHKFNAKQVVDSGIKFPSKLEHAYYQQLQLRKKAGEVVFFLMQSPIHLNSGTKMVIDFVVFLADGNVEFVEIKGIETEVFKIKKKQVESEYPFQIKILKKGDF